MRNFHWQSIRVFAFASAIACIGAAQTPAPGTDQQPPAPAPAPAAPPAWTVGPVTISGLVDGYYDINFNHPISRNNQLRNFDVKSDQFSLNMAKVTLEHTPDPVGARVDLGFGRAFEIIHGAEKAPDVFRNIEQAFVSWKPAKGKGFQADFGKFVTAAGAEVIETKDNWNYSRSLLFAWAIPYYHFGLRTTFPVGSHFTGGFHLSNGWNNVEDNNSGKTFGFMGSVTSKKATWANSYHVGPEKTDTNKGYRQLYDTTLTLTPVDNTSFYINFDYGRDKHIDRGADHWVGVTVAARFALNSWFAVAPRVEWFNDANGFSTGTEQKLKEFTLTGEFKMKEGIFMRTEYRRDWSNQPFFNRGNETANHKNQDTVLVGFVAFFGPK